MNRRMSAVFAITAIAAPVMVSAPATAQDYRDRGHYVQHDYRGRGHYRCRRSSGTTGLVAGAVGGGVLGNVLGGGTVGTLLGAGGGALLGKHLDQRHDAAQNRRNGC